MVTPPTGSEAGPPMSVGRGSPVQWGGRRFGSPLGPGYPDWSTRRNHHDATESLASLHHPRFEVFEVLNHKKAIDYMISELENEKKLD